MSEVNARRVAGRARRLSWVGFAWGAGLGGHEVEAAADVLSNVGATAGAFSAQVCRRLVRPKSRDQTRLEGLEPPTHCLEGSCSNPLSYITNTPRRHVRITHT